VRYLHNHGLEAPLTDIGDGALGLVTPLSFFTSVAPYFDLKGVGNPMTRCLMAHLRVSPTNCRALELVPFYANNSGYNKTMKS